VTKILVPQTVVTFSAKLTVIEELVPGAPTCKAMASFGGILAENSPFEETMNEDPEQTVPSAGPVKTSQYCPAGRELVNVADHGKSSLFIATKPMLSA